MTHRYRVNVWLAFADFFCALGLLTLGLYGGRKDPKPLEDRIKELEEKLKTVLAVPEKGRKIAQEIYDSLKGLPGWQGKVAHGLNDYSIVIQDAVLFDFEQRVVPPDKQPMLRPLALIIQRIGSDAFRDFSLVITGHTDDYGPLDYNMTLSKDRAEAVATALVAFGLDPAQFTILTRGVGPTAPVEDNCQGPGAPPPRHGCAEKGFSWRPKEWLQRNRRIELTLTINPAALSGGQ